jgi:hypothetical protein
MNFTYTRPTAITMACGAKVLRRSDACWEIKVTRYFTNDRLVSQGGEPYADVEISCPAFTTSHQAEMAVIEMVNRSATVTADGGIVLDERAR